LPFLKNSPQQCTKPRTKSVAIQRDRTASYIHFQITKCVITVVPKACISTAIGMIYRFTLLYDDITAPNSTTVYHLAAGTRLLTALEKPGLDETSAPCRTPRAESGRGLGTPIDLPTARNRSARPDHARRRQRGNGRRPDTNRRNPNPPGGWAGARLCGREQSDEPLLTSFPREKSIWALFTSTKNLKFFQNSPSHRIFRRMYGVLNINKNKN